MLSLGRLFAGWIETGCVNSGFCSRGVSNLCFARNLSAAAGWASRRAPSRSRCCSLIYSQCTFTV